MNGLSPLGWFLYIVVAIVVFCLAILPMTALIAFVLAGIGMAVEVAVPFGFVVGAVYIVFCVVRGAMK
jgi:energy-converting hydrogenase Eha subunit G